MIDAVRSSWHHGGVSSVDTRYRRVVRQLLRPAGPVVRVVLRTPGLHRLVSHRLLLLSFTGRRTGARYTLPVRYRRDGDLLKVITANRWWRNLRRPDTPVTLWLAGARRPATATAHRGDATTAADLAGFLATNPSLARMYGITTDADGQYSPQSLARTVDQVAIIHIRPASGVGGPAA
jgi:hypothetical protein